MAKATVRAAGFRSLAVKGALGLLILALLLAAGVLGVMTTFGQRLVLAESARRIEETGNKSVEQLSTRLSEIASLVRTLAASSGELPSEVERVKAFLPPLIDFQGDTAVAGGGYWPEPSAFTPGTDRRSFFWGRDKGNVLQYFDDYNDPAGPGYHNEEWYVPVTFAAPGSVFWSKSYMDPYSYQPMVTCTANVWRQGKLLGTATIDLKLEGLAALAQAWQKAVGGYAFVVDRNNKFLAFPDESKVKKIGSDDKGNRTEEFLTVQDYAATEPLFAPIRDAIARLDAEVLARARSQPGFDASLAAKIDAGSYQISAEEAEYIAAVLTDPLADLRRGAGDRPGTNLFTTVELPDDPFTKERSFAYVFTVPAAYWKLVLVTPFSFAAAVASEITRVLVLATATIIGLLLIVTYFVFARTWIARILNLARAAVRVRDGDLEARASVRGADELGLLGTTFNEMVGRLESYTKDLETQVDQRTAELRRSLEMTETIMGTVHEGLFLLNPELRIEPRYSHELEAIVGEGGLADRSFLDLVRRLASEKTYELTSRFLKILFDPTKSDSIVPKTNPLREIETSLELRDGRFSQKYLTFAFDRVWEGDRIRFAMVTVVDVTARVQLSREVRESERKMERQAALLLSVMHVEPSMLKDFIEGAHDELQSISALLRKEGRDLPPTERDSTFREQLDRIYRAVHTVKGTAAMLKIGYFESAAHALEDKIQALRQRQKLDGSDFVPIVLDLSDLLDSLGEVRDVIGRFAETQGQRQARGEASVLAEALEGFVAELAARHGKRARLIFQFADGVQIPFRHRKLVRDTLSQLVRNSVVHGIETVGERAAVGKPEEGEILIAARRLGNSLEILFRDDGRGIDYAKVIAKVADLARDEPTLIDELVVTEGGARQWRIEGLNDLLFRPGFSTVEPGASPNAGQDAGRGIGMSAVKEMVQAAGGRVGLRSVAGKACEVRITLPV